MNSNKNIQSTPTPTKKDKKFVEINGKIYRFLRRGETI
jgi:hypothetical protein